MLILLEDVLFNPFTYLQCVEHKLKKELPHCSPRSGGIIHVSYFQKKKRIKLKLYGKNLNKVIPFLVIENMIVQTVPCYSFAELIFGKKTPPPANCRYLISTLDTWNLLLRVHQDFLFSFEAPKHCHFRKKSLFPVSSRGTPHAGVLNNCCIMFGLFTIMPLIDVRFYF